MSGNHAVQFELITGPGDGPRMGRLMIGDLEVRTPAFMPVGTRASVKTLGSEDLEALGSRLILANTYHLHLRPGAERIARLGGLHRFMGWRGGILTDSGGFQVYSLANLRRIHPDGIEFRSHLDGSPHFLTPEGVLDIQGQLGSDIRMVLDVCTPQPAGREQTEREMALTLSWAERSRRYWAQAAEQAIRPGALFGIVQGGTFPDLRRTCAERLVDLEFDGYALGGFAVGEPPEQRWPALEAGVTVLPEERPRYMMGVGTPADILAAVARGIDLFDCVLPTRNARKGTLFTWAGKMIVKNAIFAEDQRPVDPECGCPTCRRYTRAYLRHLFQVGEYLAGRLATLHSVAFYQQLMERIREAIVAGRFAEFADELRARWAQRPPGESARHGKEDPCQSC
ncbi:MAG: tRNA guanosine(34) transglycosylase Tgt [Candidatus Eisenbacteria sp.]|nr:tRNA guanosine(34) transglycosylase Tgt [Candidatus Eisenbacteria bacterium]